MKLSVVILASGLGRCLLEAAQFQVAQPPAEKAPDSASEESTAVVPASQAHTEIRAGFKTMYSRVDEIDSALRVGAQQTERLNTGDTSLVPMMISLAKNIIAEAKELSSAASVILADTAAMDPQDAKAASNEAGTPDAAAKEQQAKNDAAVAAAKKDEVNNAAPEDKSERAEEQRQQVEEKAAERKEEVEQRSKDAEQKTDDKERNATAAEEVPAVEEKNATAAEGVPAVEEKNATAAEKAPAEEDKKANAVATGAEKEESEAKPDPAAAEGTPKEEEKPASASSDAQVLAEVASKPDEKKDAKSKVDLKWKHMKKELGDITSALDDGAGRFEKAAADGSEKITRLAEDATKVIRETQDLLETANSLVDILQGLSAQAKEEEAFVAEVRPARASLLRREGGKAN